MQSIGKKGEDLAANYLQQKGYRILSRNYRFKKSEVDIICKKNDLLVFVEVKTGSSLKYGQPEVFVSLNQQRAIIRAAEEYLVETNWKSDLRFDIISIFMKGEEAEIEHLKDAFY